MLTFATSACRTVRTNASPEPSMSSASNACSTILTNIAVSAVVSYYKEKTSDDDNDDKDSKTLIGGVFLYARLLTRRVVV